MRRLAAWGLSAILLGTWAMAQAPAGQDPDAPDGSKHGSACCANLSAQMSAAPPGELNTADREALRLMRLEEKVARDAYRKFHAAWGIRPFENIPRSEQFHLAAVKAMLDKYKVSDPLANDTAGSFPDGPAKAEYEKMVAAGAVSVTAALQEGAAFEERDIALLRRTAASTANADLKVLCDALDRASQNHFRAFHRNLARRGVTYVPTVLSAAEIQAIVGTNDAGGQGRMGGGCSGHGRGVANTAPGAGRGTGHGQGKGCGCGRGKIGAPPAEPTPAKTGA